MKNIILPIPFFICSIFFFSCSSEEDILKGLIKKTNHSFNSTKTIGELAILKDDIYSLSIHSSALIDYFDLHDYTLSELIDNKSDFKMVRYIYKTNRKVYRMFYIIDITNEKLIHKSSDFNDFYGPLCKTIFGKNLNEQDFRGDLKVELMKI